MKLRLKLLRMSLKTHIKYILALLKHHLKYPLYLIKDTILDTNSSHMENIKIQKLHAYLNFSKRITIFCLILLTYRTYAHDAMSNPDEYDILHYKFTFIKEKVQECITILENLKIAIPEELISIINNSKVNALVHDDRPFDYLVYLHSLCNSIQVI